MRKECILISYARNCGLIIYILAFILYALPVLSQAVEQIEVAKLEFEQNSVDKMDENYILINGERLIPPFDFQNKDYYALSLNALRPIEIRVGNQTQTFSLKELKAKTYISIKIGDSVYKIFTLPPGMPAYNFLYKNSYTGDLYVTPSSAVLEVPSYAYIIDEKGNLVYYRSNETPPWTLSNLNKYVLKNGVVRYSLFRQFNNLTPLSYFFGEEIIMDENFKVIDRLQILPYKNRKAHPVENHAFMILGEKHYIVTGYLETTDEKIPWKNKNIVAAVIQEIKNGEVVFDWISTDYPELYDSCLEKCNIEKLSTNQDYLHMNSFVIDPVDENLIVSMATSSQILKIDRKSGKILWKLGGFTDDFNLKKEQYFLMQHDVQLTDDGWLMFLDNRFSIPEFQPRYKDKKYMLNNLFKSRVVAFKLDGKNKKVLAFKEIPTKHPINWMGSVQKLDNGHFLIGYGSNRDIAVGEIDENGKFYMSLSLNKPYTTYKAYKYGR